MALVISKEEVETIFAELHKRTRLGAYVPEGWKELVVKTHLKLSYICPDYICHQIKDKFDGLRYYADVPPGFDPVGKSVFLDIIDHAERNASYTDMETGEPCFPKEREVFGGKH